MSSEASEFLDDVSATSSSGISSRSSRTSSNTTSKNSSTHSSQFMMNHSRQPQLQVPQETFTNYTTSYSNSMPYASYSNILDKSMSLDNNNSSSMTMTKKSKSKNASQNVFKKKSNNGGPLSESPDEQQISQLEEGNSRFYDIPSDIELLLKKNLRGGLAMRCDRFPPASQCHRTLGPGVYDPRTATGRHVANDYRFLLQKSDKQLKRLNPTESGVQTLEGSKAHLQDKYARRVAYLSLYFP